MTDVQRAAVVRGKTMRWAWTDGPTKGKTHEHTFHDDGTVEWHDADAPKNATAGAAKPDAKKERVDYGAVMISDDVTLVSYLSDSGFTLTVALNLDSGSMAGFASNDKEWHPVSGTFEIVD
ncbi:MAG TPA: hypothetical protein VM076_11440 [Gemmatimonadaceae bacterium]|nr:hypothetical protein [Gemmatimonadaceae bacterium]